ncbi:MAG: hypothetical protein P4L61_01970, partial [Candidatus Pacebacteria bacterium]|nr:hypothetical protein [Candidatus Paceibacterota bacterium]
MSERDLVQWLVKYLKPKRRLASRPARSAARSGKTKEKEDTAHVFPSIPTERAGLLATSDNIRAEARDMIEKQAGILAQQTSLFSQQKKEIEESQKETQKQLEQSKQQAGLLAQEMKLLKEEEKKDERRRLVDMEEKKYSEDDRRKAIAEVDRIIGEKQAEIQEKEKKIKAQTETLEEQIQMYEQVSREKKEAKALLDEITKGRRELLAQESKLVRTATAKAQKRITDTTIAELLKMTPDITKKDFDRLGYNKEILVDELIKEHKLPFDEWIQENMSKSKEYADIVEKSKVLEALEAKLDGLVGSGRYNGKTGLDTGMSDQEIDEVMA